MSLNQGGVFATLPKQTDRAVLRNETWRDRFATSSPLANLKLHSMKKNMGSADRLIRTALALVAAYLYFSGTLSGALGLILLIVAGIFLLTSFISFCPLYSLIRISTRKVASKG